VEESQRALECDPLNFSIGSHQAWVELEKGNYARAIQAAEPTLRLDPQHGPTAFFLMRAYEELGQLDKAIDVRRRMQWPNPPVPELEAALAAQGPAGYWRRRIARLEANGRQVPVQPFGIAIIYAHLGDRAQTLTWLEQGVEERDPKAVYIKIEPTFASLRADPRFQQIVRSAGIP
jgi:tetratricopeptide (TPR) repeat protein